MALDDRQFQSENALHFESSCWLHQTEKPLGKRFIRPEFHLLAQTQRILPDVRPNVKFWRHDRTSMLNLVHGESVEKLVTDRLEEIEVKNLKNLKLLYCGKYTKIDSTLLSDLKQLKEIHLADERAVSQLFEQKQRYDRTDLKIFLDGFLLLKQFRLQTASYDSRPKITEHFERKRSRRAELKPQFDPTIKTNLTELKMNHMPDLPLELILSYLPLEDRLSSRGVCRRWCKKIDSFTVKHLFYSQRPSRFLYEKSQLISVKFWKSHYYPMLDLVHSESVEKLVTDRLEQIEVKKMKNLKYLSIGPFQSIDSSFLSAFEQLKEIHLFGLHDASKWLKQAQRYDRTDLLIYLEGYLLFSSNDRFHRVDFLTRLTHLNYLNLNCSINTGTIRSVLKELKVLTHFKFYHAKMPVTIKIGSSKRFGVSVAERKEVWRNGMVADDAIKLIQLLVEPATKWLQFDLFSVEENLVWKKRMTKNSRTKKRKDSKSNLGY
ncbi:hypothetical protein L1887_61126 [Cichorium endivia]|nr:hypothetical protein L1887_61126 [Cichorium endivia]